MQYCLNQYSHQTPLFHHDSLTTNLHQFVLQATSKGIKQLLYERRSQGFQYLRSSEASVASGTSAAVSSQSARQSQRWKFLLLNEIDSYSLDVFKLSHNDTRDTVVSWLTQNLRINDDVCVVAERGLNEMARKQPGVNRTKIVDVVIFLSKKWVIVQIEVVSKQDPEATRRKLSIGLIDQLVYLRNNGNDVDEIKG